MALSSVRFAAALTALALTPAVAQVPGNLDPTFNTTGFSIVDITVNGDPRANSATGLALQSDGKIVMGGTAGLIGTATGPERMVLVRLNANGTLDNGFANMGRLRIDALPQGDEGYYDGRVAIAPNGFIYLFNGTQDSGGVIGWALARVGPLGALDGTFGAGGVVTATGNTLEAGDVAIHSNGQALIYEDFFDTTPNPDNQETAVGLRIANGDPDLSFGGAGGFRVVSFDLGTTRHDLSRVLYVQRDGKILAAGHAEHNLNNWDFSIARLTADGDLDDTFGGGDGKVTFSFDLPIGNIDEVRAIQVDARGRIYVGGIAGNFSTANDCALARLLPDGTLDTSFSGDGKMTFPFASANNPAFDQIFGLALQGNGSIVAVGRGTNAAGNGRTVGVARVTTAGVLDPTFAGDGTTFHQFAVGGGASVGRAVELADNGFIVLSGFTQPAANDNAFVAARLWNDYIFADGVETSDLTAWSASTP